MGSCSTRKAKPDFQQSMFPQQKGLVKEALSKWELALPSLLVEGILVSISGKSSSPVPAGMVCG